VNCNTFCCQSAPFQSGDVRSQCSCRAGGDTGHIGAGIACDGAGIGDRRKVGGHCDDIVIDG
jgi:hypothetical protein